VSQQKTKKTLINWDLVTVNPNNKTWDWKDLFCFWGVNIQSVIGFSLIASLYLIYNLNTAVVLFGTILGTFFVYIFCNLIGKPSQKFGLPFERCPIFWVVEKYCWNIYVWYPNIFFIKGDWFLNSGFNVLSR
jgi:cytosine/uracil/thiamine/allantoin permease